ncbi:MAG: hypothetical protein OXG74_00560, partial [Acidobacteria bacterium]|nr:hypothetical protein [Acidobacteriota bacterium]
MTSKRTYSVLGCVAALAFLLAACGGGSYDGGDEAVGDGPMAPRFEVDPFWPQPLPNHWILGPAIGVTVDSRDHVWIVHRNTPGAFGAGNEIGAAQDPPLSECCIPA